MDFGLVASSGVGYITSVTVSMNAIFILHKDCATVYGTSVLHKGFSLIYCDPQNDTLTQQGHRAHLTSPSTLLSAEHGNGLCHVDLPA